jgi:hypothetical protein
MQYIVHSFHTDIQWWWHSCKESINSSHSWYLVKRTSWKEWAQEWKRKRWRQRKKRKKNERMRMREWEWEWENEHQRMSIREWAWENEHDRMSMREWAWENEHDRMRMREWGNENTRIREYENMRIWIWENESIRVREKGVLRTIKVKMLNKKAMRLGDYGAGHVESSAYWIKCFPKKHSNVGNIYH